jgi:hypothetical protein
MAVFLIDQTPDIFRIVILNTIIGKTDGYPLNVINLSP